MSFEQILVLATLITAVMVIYGKFFLRLSYQTKTSNVNGVMQWLYDNSVSLLPVFILVLVIRSFMFEPFRIPSGSMRPTLYEGDFILVNKYSWGVKLPITRTTIFKNGSPLRGDVLVFKNNGQDTIKRVIGLPGDKVEVKRGLVYINGKLMKQTAVDNQILQEGHFEYKIYTEELPDRSHLIQKVYPQYLHGSGKTYIVPEGKYFVMGDNRDNSSDSRMWGFVDESDIIGKAFLIWMSWDWDNYSIRFNRIGSIN